MASVSRADKWELPEPPPPTHLPRRPGPPPSASDDSQAVLDPETSQIIDSIPHPAAVQVLKIYVETVFQGEQYDKPPPLDKDVYNWDAIMAVGATKLPRHKASLVYLLKWTGYPWPDWTWVEEKNMNPHDLVMLWRKHGRPELPVEWRRQKTPKRGRRRESYGRRKRDKDMCGPNVKREGQDIAPSYAAQPGSQNSAVLAGPARTDGGEIASRADSRRDGEASPALDQASSTSCARRTLREAGGTTHDLKMILNPPLAHEL